MGITVMSTAPLSPSHRPSDLPRQDCLRRGEYGRLGSVLWVVARNLRQSLERSRSTPFHVRERNSGSQFRIPLGDGVDEGDMLPVS